MIRRKMPDSLTQRVNTAKSGVVGRLSWAAARTTNLFVDNSILKRGSAIIAYKQKIPLERDTIMIFADEEPRLNWAHSCSYLLHDAATGEFYKEIKARFPPYLNGDPPKTWAVFHQPVQIYESSMLYPVLPVFRCFIKKPKGKRYAILFSGASNNRHTNDLEFLYRTLRDIYGFAAADIYVLNYDGTINYNGVPKPVGNWPGDSSAYRMPVNGQGTKAAFNSVLDTIKSKLKPDDMLLIHTNNHGGHNGSQSYLCTYSGDDYLASDFADKLATLPNCYCLMVMMEQCHAGGFNAPIIAHSTATHTSVSSACQELRSSIGGPNFDPFARDWISSMYGSTPSGGALASNPDTDSTGKVSAREAHNYADSLHDSYDTPVYNESSVTAGNCFLGQRYLYLWPIYCRMLYDALYPYYTKRPIPEFYEILHTKLVPQLEGIEANLTELTRKNEEELRTSVASIVKKVMR
jgi:hypothetical protein